MSDLTYVYASVLDVLGYRQRLEDDRTSGYLTFKDDLQKALQVLNEINEVEYNYQAISDTVIITCSDRDNFIDYLNVLKSVELAFLEQGLFVRGGIAYAKHFKSKCITYSHAIALAHEIEMHNAIYPRIIIDHNIIDMFEAAEEISSLINSGLIYAANGIYFLNIIDKENWKAVYQYAKNIYKRQGSQLLGKEYEFSKHAWFEDYLFASPFADGESSFYIPKVHQLEMCDLIGQ